MMNRVANLPDFERTLVLTTIAEPGDINHVPVHDWVARYSLD